MLNIIFKIFNIYLTEIVFLSCKLSPTVSKASSGVLELTDIYQIGNLEEFIVVIIHLELLFISRTSVQIIFNCNLLLKLFNSFLK